MYNSSVVSPYVDETVFRLLHVCWAVIAIAQHVVSTTTTSKTNVIYDAVFACMVVYRFMRLYPIGAIVYMLFFLCLQDRVVVLRQNQYMCPLFGCIVTYVGYKKTFSHFWSVVYLASSIMTYLFFLFSTSFRNYGFLSLLCTSLGYISFSLMSTYELALIPYPTDTPVSLLSVMYYTYVLKVARLAYTKMGSTKTQIQCFPTFFSACVLSIMGIYECLSCVFTFSKTLDPYSLRCQSIYFYVSYLLFDSFSRRREPSFYSLDGFVHHVATGVFAVYALWSGNVIGMSYSFIAEVSTIILTLKKMCPRHRHALSRVFPYFFIVFRVILLVLMYIHLLRENSKTREYPYNVMNIFLSALVVFTTANMCWFRLILLKHHSS